MVESNQSTSFWPHLYEPFSRMGTRLKNLVSPASDASSNDNAYRVSIELPGVSEDDIELTAADGLLTVTGEKSEQREESGDTWYFAERQFGAFRRSFRLADDADTDKTEAHMKDGVLEVTIPRREIERKGGKKIAVQKA